MSARRCERVDIDSSQDSADRFLASLKPDDELEVAWAGGESGAESGDQQPTGPGGAFGGQGGLSEPGGKAESEEGDGSEEAGEDGEESEDELGEGDESETPPPSQEVVPGCEAPQSLAGSNTKRDPPPQYDKKSMSGRGAGKQQFDRQMLLQGSEDDLNQYEQMTTKGKREFREKWGVKGNFDFVKSMKIHAEALDSAKQMEKLYLLPNEIMDKFGKGYAAKKRGVEYLARCTKQGGSWVRRDKMKKVTTYRWDVYKKATTINERFELRTEATKERKVGERGQPEGERENRKRGGGDINTLEGQSPTKSKKGGAEGATEPTSPARGGGKKGLRVKTGDPKDRANEKAKNDMKEYLKIHTGMGSTLSKKALAVAKLNSVKEAILNQPLEWEWAQVKVDAVEAVLLHLESEVAQKKDFVSDFQTMNRMALLDKYKLEAKEYIGDYMNKAVPAVEKLTAYVQEMLSMKQASVTAQQPKKKQEKRIGGGKKKVKVAAN